MAVASLQPSRSNNQQQSFHDHQQHQTNFIFTSASDQSWSQRPALAIPRSTQTPAFNFSSPINSNVGEFPLPLEQVPELMNEHHWQASSAQEQQQHFSSPRGIVGLPAHQRNSSLSTLGSAGPSSPYTQTSSNPQIAVTDSASDGFPDVAFQDGSAMYGAKHSMGQESFYSQYPSSLSHTRHHQQFHTTGTQGHRNGGNLLPPPEFQYSASNPVSVASSIASDSPATPCMDDHQPSGKRQKQQSFNSSVPKLGRTMTDVFSDELYNPNFPLNTTVSPSTPVSAVSPSSDIFNQRIHAANTQHLSAAHSPATTISRERSPFRHGSPLAPLSQDFSAANGGSGNKNRITRGTRMPAPSHQDMRFSSSQHQHQIKMERDAAAAVMLRHHQHQHQQRVTTRQHDTNPVKTISPKDAMLEFAEPGDAANFPLFPQQDGAHTFLGLGDAPSVAHSNQGFSSIPVTAAQDETFGSFIPTSMPDQYHAFMARNHDSTDIHGISTDMHQMQHQEAQHMQTPTSPQKPASSSTDRGTFSCTYQGCPLRFETAALLQKHKREGHRQAHGIGGGRRDASMMAGSASTQNGPHKCTQVNPSTGKPCNTEFSRPYDLTRHEDTIHNPKKKKVTCPACTDKKQFSRGDALSRHYRVCHPDLSPPGKRRGGAARG